MKKIFRYLGLLFILMLIISSHVSSQNSILQTGITPSGPVSAGSIVTIEYQIDFTEVNGKMQQFKVVFDNSLEFVSSNLQTASGNMFHYVSGSTAGPNMVYQTDIFVNGDNYGYSATFTISYRVINTICSSVVSSPTAYLSTFSPETDIQSAGATITIINTNSNPTVGIDLLEGEECSTALYKITSFGYEDPTHIGLLKLRLPNCAIIQGVYNSAGNPISVSGPFAAGVGYHQYTWQRSGITGENLQIHYVQIQSTCTDCSDMRANFDSYNICTNVTQAAPEAIRSLDYCHPCPVTVIDVGCGVVILKKWLEKAPLRYLPAPDNCVPHDYVIRIANISCHPLNALNISDLISTIVPGYPTAVKVLAVTLSVIPILPALGSFGFTISPPVFIAPSITMGGSAIGNYGGTWVAGIGNTGGSWIPQPLNIQGTTALPPYSSLLIKITHVLNSNIVPSASAYTNTANISFTANNIPYNGSVQAVSYQDAYEPIIIIDKKVRTIQPVTGPFLNSVITGPGDKVQFAIRISNYGMRNVSATLHDLISNPLNNLDGITNLSVTETSSGGMVYSPGELVTIKNSIASIITTTGFNPVNIATVRAGICIGHTELTISFDAKVKTCDVVTCNSTYSNTASIDWVWNGENQTAGPVTATVNVDVYKNLEAKLEATCSNQSSAIWVTNSIDGVPGTTIFYRASIRNRGSCDMKGVKMMILLPNNPFPQTSMQNSILGFLNGSAPVTPTGTGLYLTVPFLSTPISPEGTRDNTAIFFNNNWLNNNIIPPAGTMSSLPTTKFIYKYIPVLPVGATAVVLYSIKLPINAWLSQYNTSFGYSKGSTISPFNCTVVAKKKELTLTLRNTDACGHLLSGCDQLLFDSEILQTGVSTYRITLSNIYDFNGGWSPNIHNIDLVVHEPYSNCPPDAGSPYMKKMWPVILSHNVHPSSSLITIFTGNVLGRMHRGNAGGAMSTLNRICPKPVKGAGVALT